MPARKSSLRELVQLQNRMNCLFDELLGPEGAAASQLEDISWIPAADIYETQTHFYVEMELPGVTMERVDVTVLDNILRVSGEKRLEEISDSHGVQRMERYAGPFYREFNFPEPLMNSEIEATLKDGLLLLKISKKKQSAKVRVK